MELTHFALAERFGVDPYAVLHEWPEQMYVDALAIVNAEARYRRRHPNGSGE